MLVGNGDIHNDAPTPGICRAGIGADEFVRQRVYLPLVLRQFAAVSKIIQRMIPRIVTGQPAIPPGENDRPIAPQRPEM